MSFITEIKLILNSPNTVASSANNVTGYKIYRDIQTDPCPGGVIDSTKQVDSGSVALGQIIYSDTNTAVSVAYFYRVSWLRNSEELLSEVIGPLMIGSLYELGYPNNVPSDTSGNPNFMSIEPLVHFDAGFQYNISGAGPAGSLINLSDRYPSLSQTTSYDVGIGIDGVTPVIQVPRTGNPGSTGAHSPINLDNFRGDIINGQWQGAGVGDNDVGAVVFDEGITIAFAFQGATSHPAIYDSATDTFISGNWWLGNASGNTSFTCFSATNQKQYSTNTLYSGRPLQPRKFSDGSLWADPRPPYGVADTLDPGWMPRYSYWSPKMSWNAWGHSTYGFPTTWQPSHSPRVWRSNVPTRNYRPGGLSSQYSRLKTKGVNIILATVYPDGSWISFMNGNLEQRHGPAFALLGDLNGSPTSYDIASTGSWHIDTDGTVDAGTYYDISVRDYNTAGNFMLPYYPVPFVTMPSAANIRTYGSQVEPFSGGSSLSPFYQASYLEWSEYLVFPKAFGPQDIARIHNYFTSKYETLADHEDYNTL